MVLLEQLRQDDEVNCYIETANQHLGNMGFTEHSFRHANIVAEKAEKILEKLHFPPRFAELAAIAGYLHDIGNVVSRYNHSQSGATLAFAVLKRLGMECSEIAQIMGAIGNHDEGEGQIVNTITAALVLADKTDVQRSRVRNKDIATFDIHDRVNFAVKSADLLIDEPNRLLTLVLDIDQSIVPVIEYFEIFMTRMLMCRRAANFLNCQFSIIINEAKVL